MFKKITISLFAAILLITLPLLADFAGDLKRIHPAQRQTPGYRAPGGHSKPLAFHPQTRPTWPQFAALQAKGTELQEPSDRTNKPEGSFLSSPPRGNQPFPAKGIPILMYHSIASLPGNNLGVPPEKFAAQVKYLYDAGYTTISFTDFYAAYQGQAILPKKPIILTFDDGYPDNYGAAFPILKQYNFTATFFVVTGSINQGMLTWDQLKEMQGAGMSIESHTVNHFDLRTLPPNRQRSELGESKREIERVLGKPVSVFCYPSGKYNDATLAILNELGYKLAVTTEPGYATQKDQLLRLKRVRINGDASLEAFKRQLP